MYSHNQIDSFSQNLNQDPRLSHSNGGFQPQHGSFLNQNQNNSNYLETVNQESDMFTPINMDDYGVDMSESVPKEQIRETPRPSLRTQEFVEDMCTQNQCCTTDTPLYLIAVMILILAFAVIFSMRGKKT